MAREMSNLWALVQDWLDGQRFPPTQAKLAEAIGVSRSALSEWKYGDSKPSPENLARLAEVTGIRNQALLDAMNRDMGYAPDAPAPRGRRAG